MLCLLEPLDWPPECVRVWRVVLANDKEPLAQFLQVTWFAAIDMEILDGVLLDAYCREDCGAVWEHGKKQTLVKVFGRCPIWFVTLSWASYNDHPCQPETWQFARYGAYWWEDNGAYVVSVSTEANFKWQLRVGICALLVMLSEI